MKIVVLAFAAFLAQSAASATTLWRDVQPGASVQEVQLAIPEAVEASEPSVLFDGKTKGLLEVSGFQVGGVDFKATLYFKDESLDRVFLAPAARPSGEAAFSLLAKLRDGLNSKYGEAISSQESEQSFSTSFESTWRSDGVLIKLSFNKYGETSPAFVQISYISSSDASNL